MEEQVVQGKEIVVKANKDKSFTINKLSVIGRNTYIKYALCLFHRIGLNSKHYKSTLNEFLKTLKKI